MVKAYIGHVVWFYESGKTPEADLPTAAIITTIVSDDLVRLCVFNREGHPEPVTREGPVPFIQEGYSVPLDGNYCISVIEKPEHKPKAKTKAEPEEEPKPHGHKKHHA